MISPFPDKLSCPLALAAFITFGCSFCSSPVSLAKMAPGSAPSMASACAFFAAMNAALGFSFVDFFFSSVAAGFFAAAAPPLPGDALPPLADVDKTFFGSTCAACLSALGQCACVERLMAESVAVLVPLPVDGVLDVADAEVLGAAVAALPRPLEDADVVLPDGDDIAETGSIP